MVHRKYGVTTALGARRRPGRPRGTNYATRMSKTVKNQVAHLEKQQKVTRTYLTQGMSKVMPPPKQKMRWIWNNNLENSASRYKIGQPYIFSMNNLNSPYFYQAAGDLLPYGYAANALAYKRFKVHQFDVKVEFMNCTSTDDLELIFHFKPSSDAANIASGDDIDAWSNKPMTWTYPLPKDEKYVFKKKIKIYEVEGLSELQFKADFMQYSSPYSQNRAYAPPLGSYFEMGLANNSSTTVQSVAFEIQIDYHVENLQPQPLDNTYST